MKKPSFFRLSAEAIRLLSLVASKMGLTKTGALEVVIRDAAKKRGVKAE